MAVYPTSLSNAFDDALRPITSGTFAVDADQKERSLRDAVRYWTIRRPDERSFLLTYAAVSATDPRMLLPADADLYDVFDFWGGQTAGIVRVYEYPLGKMPRQRNPPETVYFDPEGSEPTHLGWYGQAPSANDPTFRLVLAGRHYYMLNTPAAPTVTGTAGANNWTYRICARNDGGSTAGGASTTFASAAAAYPVDHVITWSKVQKATSYDVWLSAAPMGVTAPALIANVRGALTYSHTTAAGTSGTVPTSNTTETSIAEPYRAAVGRKGASLAIDGLMAIASRHTRDSSGTGAIDWTVVRGELAELKKTLDDEFEAFLERTAPASAKSAETSSAIVFAPTGTPEEVYGEPALRFYRTPDRMR